MAQPKFTPGPWIADCDLPGLALKHPMVRARGCTVAEVIPQSSAEANARLIAAAPDLYAALEAAEALLKLHGYPAFKNSDSIRAQARAALRKADGHAST